MLHPGSRVQLSMQCASEKVDEPIEGREAEHSDILCPIHVLKRKVVVVID